MNLLKRISYVLIATLILASCSSDDDNIMPLGDYEFGFFVTNEGPFGTGTGTVSFISNDFTNVDQTIFNDVNNSDLGNIVNSMGFSGENAYIVANNSHKIEVVNRYTFESIATITEGLDNPRHFAAIGTKGFVSNWGDPFNNDDDFIAVIDLNTNTVVASIPVSFGPEKMVVNDGNLYVAHQGGYGQNNIISIIKTSTNALISAIVVGDVPNSLVVSGNSLWILCGGNPDYTGNETNGSLVELNMDNQVIEQTFNFELTQHPSGLTMDDINLYYGLNGAVFSMEESDISLPTESIINGLFYSITAYRGILFATDAGDFTSNGTLKIFDLSTNNEIESIEVGIIPGGVYFNN